jgi:exosortase
VLHGARRNGIRRMDHGSIPSLFDRTRVRAGALLLVVVALAYTYKDVATALVRQWGADDNYSHGFLIVPLAIYFVWARRATLRQVPARPSSWGVLVVGFSLGAFLAGIAAAELFVARASFIGVVAGSIVFLFGWRHLRVLAFPVAFLVLMIPPPEIVFNQVALPLQLFASQAGEVVLRGAGVPVLRDGNVLELVSMRLEVAEACSGIRSIVSLLTFALVLGQFSGCSRTRMLLLCVATIPIAIVANATRVAATGLAAHAWGPAVAEGLLHSSSGLLVFAAAVVALLIVERTTARVRLPVARRVAS